MALIVCKDCKREVSDRAAACPHCGRPISPRTGPLTLPAGMPLPTPAIVFPQKNPGVGAVLSFFWAGLGQIYNGQFGKGIAFIVTQMINAVLMLAVIGFLTFFLTRLYGMIDAYSTATDINAGRKRADWE
jgi:TM2 domain-containing membrane protein YozV